MLSRAGFKPRVEEFEPRIVPAGLWADAVVDFSSEYSSVYNGAADYWDADQALGEPNTMSYDDIVTAWAPLPMNAGGAHDRFEHLTVRFANPVNATGVMIRETFGNGFVTQVDFLSIDANGTQTVHTWTGADPSQPGSPVDFTISIAATNTPVNAVKIYVDIDHDLGAWEEIDAVQLLDGVNTAPVISSVTLDNTAPKTNDVLTATVAGSDADGDAITYQYVWYVNGTAVQTTTTTMTTATLDLSLVGNGNKGDTIQLKVTPSDATAAGNDTFSDAVTVLNSAPVILPFAAMHFVEGDEVDIVVNAYDADGDGLAFTATDLPDGLTLIDYYNGSALISGVVQRHSGAEPTKQFPVKIRVTDNTDADEVSPFCTSTNFTITSAVITPLEGFNGTVGNAPTQFTAVISGLGAPIVQRTSGFWWTVADDEDGGYDDELTNEAFITPNSLELNGAWSRTVTFRIHRDSNNYVAGPDGSSGRATANLYILLEDIWKINYPYELSNRVEVTAATP